MGSSNKLIIGQVKTDEKSNEITAIPELLDMLLIKGSIVTIDAMGCQKDIAEKIVRNNKADYVLALKENHKVLYNEVEEYFKDVKREKVKDEKIECCRTM
ncbi:MAG: ISAs1 family transposase [Clostridium sp.]|jgi:predicted transposase YbfD/YdcC|uniref:ISAs1 family transposase n=1 Tax=Clostridium sp. TaxID=1506 RepID=UPI0025C33405|nr:ISAs1 family transposase [Clostridium sp.]MCH3965188.1 ISAs1 family transposase [Clostridium sp.]MCI1714408.1 ISAs1 family transposase [Clostridium sp.]MCI1798670.1 ISAs1 family transposase [Clostridium sp.]MCI1812599.1 ISAs1 family transposase [Clostridium sp.]MCI1869479.1 ISAs1 family transposase [Clostridium sp.]